LTLEPGQVRNPVFIGPGWQFSAHLEAHLAAEPLQKRGFSSATSATMEFPPDCGSSFLRINTVSLRNPGVDHESLMDFKR